MQWVVAAVAESSVDKLRDAIDVIAAERYRNTESYRNTLRNTDSQSKGLKTTRENSTTCPPPSLVSTATEMVR